MNIESIFNRDEFSFDLSEFKPVWVGPIPFIVPNYISLYQEKYLVASQLTLLLRNVSVDNVLKNWMHDFEIDRKQAVKDEKKQLIDKTLQFIKGLHNKCDKQLSSIEFGEGTISSVTCEAVFLRLTTTMRSINFHIKYGYYYESFAMIRLVQEQLAYAYTASQVADGSITDFLSPTASIKHLKKLIPESGAMYGLLSKRSHLDMSTISKYLRIKDNKSYTVTHSVYFSLEALIYYLHIIDYYNIVFEFCFRKHLKKYNNIVIRKNKAIVINEKRRNKKTITNYIEKIKYLLEKEGR